MHHNETKPSRHRGITLLLVDSATAGQELARVYAALVHKVGGPSQAPPGVLRVLLDCYLDEFYQIIPSIMRSRRTHLPGPEAWHPAIEVAAQEVCEVAELLTRRLILGAAEPIAPVTWWPTVPPHLWLDPEQLARCRAALLDREVTVHELATTNGEHTLSGGVQ